MEQTRQHIDRDALRRLKHVLTTLFPDARVEKCEEGLAIRFTFEGKDFERRFADPAECSRHAKGAMRELLHEVYEHLWSPEAHILEVELTRLEDVPMPESEAHRTHHSRPAALHTPAPTGHQTMAVSQAELQQRLNRFEAQAQDASRSTTTIKPHVLAAHLAAAREQNAPLKERCLQGLKLLGFAQPKARKLPDERFGFTLEPGAKEVLTDITQLTADLPGTLQWLAATHPRQR